MIQKMLTPMITFVLLLLSSAVFTSAFAPGGYLLPSQATASSSALFSVGAATWNNGNSYGKGQFTFYKSFDEWMAPFPAEDRELYPEVFRIPDGVFEVRMAKPLGIVFEEVEAGGGAGVFVTDLVEGGNAERMGIVKPGDKLIGVTAVKVIGAKWERRLIPCGTWDFDTVVDAIGSNDIKWGCNDVVLQFERPGEADEDALKSHLEFFEPPFDSSFRRG